MVLVSWPGFRWSNPVYCTSIMQSRLGAVSKRESSQALLILLNHKMKQMMTKDPTKTPPVDLITLEYHSFLS